ncbi:MAG: response regulator transcription factor [Sphingosinicella sp.]|nr:response regulator transcription factor [Sphingosinicella sp.]
MIHIVDDDAHVRDSTTFLLRSRGYATESYSDGRAFLEESTLEGECVLLDLRMPEMSGLEVQEALSSRNVDLPVIILSGHGDAGSAIEAMRLGAVAYIEKPYLEDDLVAAIARASAFSAHRANVRDEAAAQVAGLSIREREILQGLLAGHSIKRIAHAIDLSPGVVEMHRDDLFDALGVSSIAGAVGIGFDAQLEPHAG